MTRPIVLPSLSAAMDGGFTAIADMSTAMAASGTTDQHRLYLPSSPGASRGLGPAGGCLVDGSSEQQRVEAKRIAADGR